jgi:hypothetical protein
MALGPPLARSPVELGTERESLLQVLDENANFGGQAAGRPYGKDGHGSLKRSQKTDDRAFSWQSQDVRGPPSASAQYHWFERLGKTVGIFHASSLASRKDADCAYYSIPIGASRSINAVWTYEHPYDAASPIKDYLAFAKEPRQQHRMP